MLRPVLFYLAIGIMSLLPAAELTVATFNVRLATRGDQGTRNWNARKDLVVETIRKMSPDLLGVQEALPQQMDYLSEGLPGYERF